MTPGRLRRVGYGAAEIGVSGSEVMLRVSLLIYYTQKVGLRPDLASYAIAAAVLWDAITDPLMGQITDRSNIANQKRRPFLLPGAVGLAVFLMLVFNVPNLETQSEKFLYLLLTYLGTNTFLTILSVPHTALAGDISKDPQIRLELFGWRMIFSNLGLILGTAIPAIVVLSGIDNHTTEAVASWGIGGLILLGVLITLWSTLGLDRVSSQEPESRLSFSSFRRELGQVAADRSFLWLVGAYTTATIGLTLNSSLALYYYQFYLKLGDASVRSIIAFFMLIFCLAIPLWIWTTKFFSKGAILMANVTALGMMTIFGYPNFPIGGTAWPYAAGLFGGIFVASVVLMDVAVADLADGKARGEHSPSSNFGLYFGFWKMSAKISRAMALILTGNALAWIGFDVGVTPSDETAYYLALLFGPGVGVFLLAAVGLIYLGHQRGVSYQ